MAMLHITGTALKLAYDLGQLRSPPSPAAGPKSRTHLYTLQYDGGNELGFWWTDYRTTIFCKLPVTPRDRTPWTVSVTASIYREPRTKVGKRAAKPAKDNEKPPKDISKNRPFDGEMDPRLRHLPEIMQSSKAAQQNGTGGFLSSRPGSATLTVDLKNPLCTLEGRKKVYLWLAWEAPETSVTRMVQTLQGRKQVTMREWEKLHDPLKGYLEPDFQLADMLAEQGPRETVNLRTLRKALRFLTKGPRGQDVNDVNDRTKTCTLFRDGAAMAADSGRRRNAIVLLARGPLLPFDVTVHRSDAETIAKWLRVVSKDLGPKFSEVEITNLTTTSRPRYCFRDPTGKHWLWISAVPRPFLRAVIDPTLAITPRFAVQVNHRSLLMDANLFGHQAEERKLVCAVRTDGTGACKLYVRANSTQPSPNQDTLDGTLHVAAESSFTGWAFAVHARDLIAALRRFSADDVLLVSRSAPQGHVVSTQPDHGWGWLEVRAATDASDAIWTAIGPQAFVRITPQPMPAVVGPAVAVSAPAAPAPIPVSSASDCTHAPAPMTQDQAQPQGADSATPKSADLTP